MRNAIGNKPHCHRVIVSNVKGVVNVKTKAGN